MKYIYFLLLGIIFYSCSASDQNNTGQQSKTEINPCKDSLYLVYRTLPPNALTDEQKLYLKNKEKECSDYTELQKQNKKGDKPGSPNVNLVMVLGAALVACILLTYLIFTGK